MPNIEIKARCSNLDKARETAERLKTTYIGNLHQIDTYYKTKEGRLKLREINEKEAQLIPYFKEYAFGPMKSNYSLLPVENPEHLKNILDKILGTLTVVDKKREVFLINNIRVHLDEVKNLGSFVEFEAVYEENSIEDKEREIKKVSELLDIFQIGEDDLLDKSYIDYLIVKDLFSSNLETLYAFENESMIVAEFERKNIEANLVPDKRFFWLIFDKIQKSLKRLEFVSMDSNKQLEQRIFKQGTLEFNSSQANFKNSEGGHKLTATSICMLGPYSKAVLSYFENL